MGKTALRSKRTVVHYHEKTHFNLKQCFEFEYILKLLLTFFPFCLCTKMEIKKSREKKNRKKNALRDTDNKSSSKLIGIMFHSINITGFLPCTMKKEKSCWVFRIFQAKKHWLQRVWGAQEYSNMTQTLKQNMNYIQIGDGISVAHHPRLGYTRYFLV